MNSGAQLDMEQLGTLRLLRNGQLLGNLIRAYRAQVPQQIAEMQAALQANDIAGIARVAHSLKSASFTLGATQMGQLSTTLESAAMQCDGAQCSTLITTMQQHYEVLLPELMREEQA